MKKSMQIFLGIVVVLCPFLLFSQTPDTAKTAKSWLIKNTLSININQTGYTRWAGGGQNSFSLGAIENFNATCTKEHYLFDSYANFAYGVMKQQDDDFWRKTDDKIDIMANNSWKMKVNNPHWFYGFLFTMTSQFANGYNYDLGEPSDSTRQSAGLSPAYFNLAPGITYRLDDRFSWFFSPCNGRLLLVADQEIADLGLYGNTMEAAGGGNPVGDKVNLGMGLFTELRWKQPLTKGIDIDTKLRVSNNYLDERTDNRWNFDIDYLLMLNFSITKYISANLRMEVLYDDDTQIEYKKDGIMHKGPVVQLKEVIGIGFAWNFVN